jgi:hypothetical protein
MWPSGAPVSVVTSKDGLTITLPAAAESFDRIVALIKSQR